MEKVIKEGRFFTTEHEGKTYKARFYHNFTSGIRLGDGSYHFDVEVWEIRYLKIFKLNIPYPVYIHTYNTGTQTGLYSSGSFKWSESLDSFYLKPDDAKWLVPAAISDKAYEDRMNAAKKKQRNSYKHQSKI